MTPSALNDPAAFRHRVRRGEWAAPTAGLVPGFVQVNLVTLPADEAADFHRFCTANPRPCPVLAVSAPGSHALPSLGTDIDLRSDLPRYRVFHDGELVDEPTDVAALWRTDLVSFAIGCSFTFEHSLIEHGLGIRHIEQGREAPLYLSNIATQPVGKYAGPMVVSMRPFKARDAIRAIQVTSRFPGVHGAPLHLGRPDLIGIRDLGRPDHGEPVHVADDELPLFWACGVTPQSVVRQARPRLCITHSPNHMLVTDLRNAACAVM